ncbi:hypothetical protein [Chitinophaga rhizosphaerae]|uniref:hypothetical protein n=1 Tax=Chitinophaga rhizosphaerae TaxID=1864947 RepID=UPI000F80F8A8|nr:hypothetical protein [Chitinophaga rhizosphaerae]
MVETRYCAFIDVLGYKVIVTDDKTTLEQKARTLQSIYENLATQFIWGIGHLNTQYEDKVYVRSFSDCFYLDCASIEPLLVAVGQIFTSTFNFYSNFKPEEETTPFLRCGIVKDWVIKFKDIGSMVNGTNELNPVGLAVARAYLTSEKSKLSGMRVIVSPEVINDLQAVRNTIPEFSYFTKDIREYNVSLPYYFKPININEKGEPSELYEMLWPVNYVNDHADTVISVLQGIRPTIPKDEQRHLIKTAQMFADSYLLSEWREKDGRIFQRDLLRLQLLATPQEAPQN